MADPTDASTEPITIILADDHPIVRSGLRMLLEAEDDFDVIAESGDTDSARRSVLTRRVPSARVLITPASRRVRR